MVSKFHHMAFLNRWQSEADHGACLTEASLRSDWEQMSTQVPTLVGSTPAPLTVLQGQHEGSAIQLHFLAPTHKFKAVKRRICHKDNKWPWVHLSCYHWFWSLSGLTLEILRYISCNFTQGPKTQAKEKRKKEKKNRLISGRVGP